GAAHPTGLVMTDLHRVVAARALGNPQFDQPLDRLASPAEAVGDDEALRVFGANGLDEPFDYARVFLLGNIGRLVQQIKAEAVAVKAPVAFGQHSPMKSASIERFLIGP